MSAGREELLANVVHEIVNQVILFAEPEEKRFANPGHRLMRGRDRQGGVGEEDVRGIQEEEDGGIWGENEHCTLTHFYTHTHTGTCKNSKEKRKKT